MKLRLSRALDDIPPLATDAELIEWASKLRVDATPDERPRPPIKLKRRIGTEPPSGRMSDDELFADIFERAAAVTGAQAG